MGLLNTNYLTAKSENDEIQIAYQSIQPLILDGRQDLAITAMSEFAEKYPDFAQAHNDLGVLYYQTGQKEKAFSHYQKASSLKPDNIIFQKNIADFYLVEKRDIEKSLSIYTQILSENPMDIETLLAIGQVCVALNKYEDAAAFFNKIVDIEPWNQTAWKALELISQSDSEKISVRQESPDSLYQKVRACLTSGKQKEAIELLEEMVELFPDNALAYNELGVLHFKLGDKIKSLSYYQKAVQIEPANPVFQKNLADLYLVEFGQTEKALTIYLKVLKQEPADLETLFALGYSCIQMEKFEDARIFFDRILAIEPWNLTAQEFVDSLPGA